MLDIEVKIEFNGNVPVLFLKTEFEISLKIIGRSCAVQKQRQKELSHE